MLMLIVFILWLFLPSLCSHPKWLRIDRALPAVMLIEVSLTHEVSIKALYLYPILSFVMMNLFWILC